MTLDRQRRNRRRRWATALAVLLTATFAAGPALAGHRNRGHDRHDGYDRSDRHERHYRHGRRHHRRHHRRHAYRHHRGYPVYTHGYGNGYAEKQAYYCGPCQHRFGGYDALSAHVHSVHHIPLWRLPFVIVHSAFHGVVGLIFFG